MVNNNKNIINTDNEIVLISNPLNIENENILNSENEMNVENVLISSPTEIPSIKECLNTIKSTSSLPISLDQYLTTKIL